ncbi:MULTISPECIES: glycine cleavage system protein GcvH [unclassified Paenibacillus]|uniref:glycine cleavage system protein GcvH n=1 Tax=unclassified Paenibacillus TaxID=185978 RepID=UPI001AE544ED|nr:MULTISPECIES: glycine cleavage system protein GcvH [unclassified Paenibacillus]MBP1156732.1 glycine cleavage system H protein [Paenibacillus sp. PvP091]MBP1172530.1 glycine cleavage system H protein [Paenibacillus sp. PvR098]MBP2438910.1 glycine cleavage system H protein [Paenibacillus sp. PvP052]
MSEVKANVFYSKEHEWADISDSGTVRVGISDFAQCELGDIVFVEFPELGARVQAGDPMGTIESVKTVSDLFAPVSGIITKVNTSLLDQPELVNEQPYEGGWIVEMEWVQDAQEEMNGLLTAEQYKAFIDEHQ